MPEPYSSERITEENDETLIRHESAVVGKDKDRGFGTRDFTGHENL